MKSLLNSSVGDSGAIAPGSEGEASEGLQVVSSREYFAYLRSHAQQSRGFRAPIPLSRLHTRVSSSLLVSGGLPCSVCSDQVYSYSSLVPFVLRVFLFMLLSFYCRLYILCFEDALSLTCHNVLPILSHGVILRVMFLIYFFCSYRQVQISLSRVVLIFILGGSVSFLLFLFQFSIPSFLLRGAMRFHDSIIPLVRSSPIVLLYLGC